MAARYWVGGAATPNWNESTGGVTNWGTASDVRDNASVPTASDDVVFDNSANGNSPCDITATARFKSLDASAYTNTLTHGDFGLVMDAFIIGGSLTFGANMTYVVSSSSVITTNNHHTWYTNGKLMPSISMGGSTGGGAIRLGDNMKFAAGHKTINASAGNRQIYLNGFTISGYSASNRLLFTGFGQNRYLWVQGGSFENCDFENVQFNSATSLDLSAIPGGSGDCGGSTITGGGTTITFTTPAAQTWQGSSGGDWSSAGDWSGRIPLPQDDAIIASAFSAGQTIVANMPRLGKSIDFTGTTGNPTFALTSLQNSIFGSLTLVADMTLSRSQILNFMGRGSHTITLAGNGLGFNQLFFNSVGGTYTLMDDFSMPDELQHQRGGLVANNVNVSIRNLVSTGTNTRSLTLGTGTWTLSRADSSVWSAAATGLTLSAADATIVIGSTGTATRTFAGGGLAYGTLSYILNGSTGALLIQGSNTFTVLNFRDANNARTLRLTADTTTTIVSALNVNGTSGKLMTIESSTSGTPATLAKTGGIVSCRYLNLRDIAATGGALWYAGTSSTNVSGNSGWAFAPPYMPQIVFS